MQKLILLTLVACLLIACQSANETEKKLQTVDTSTTQTPIAVSQVDTTAGDLTTVGPLSLGMTAVEVINILGEPTEKGISTEWGS